MSDLLNFDALQDERAEHNLEAGDLLTALEFHKLTTQTPDTADSEGDR